LNCIETMTLYTRFVRQTGTMRSCNYIFPHFVLLAEDSDYGAYTLLRVVSDQNVNNNAASSSLSSVIYSKVYGILYFVLSMLFLFQFLYKYL